MQSFRLLAFGISFLMAASAQGQGILSAHSVAAAGSESAIGPDGTYYTLVPGAGSTPLTRTSELMAIGIAATPSVKWTASVTGELGSILPGTNTVFIVQTVVSGSGRTTTATTSILSYAAATGAHGTSITPAGVISDIQVRTIGGSDYLYVTTTSISSGTSGGTTVSSITRTLTIYSQTGTVIKTVTL